MGIDLSGVQSSDLLKLQIDAAELGGADGITLHLREDRRHIQDTDLAIVTDVMSTHMNPSFASSSRSKQSVGIDVKSPRGLELVEELVRQSDVLIENNGGGVMERLGLGPEDLAPTEAVLAEHGNMSSVTVLGRKALRTCCRSMVILAMPVPECS